MCHPEIFRDQPGLPRTRAWEEAGARDWGPKRGRDSQEKDACWLWPLLREPGSLSHSDCSRGLGCRKSILGRLSGRREERHLSSGFHLPLLGHLLCGQITLPVLLGHACMNTEWELQCKNREGGPSPEFGPEFGAVETGLSGLRDRWGQENLKWHTRGIWYTYHFL